MLVTAFELTVEVLLRITSIIFLAFSFQKHSWRVIKSELCLDNRWKENSLAIIECQAIIYGILWLILCIGFEHLHVNTFSYLSRLIFFALGFFILWLSFFLFVCFICILTSSVPGWRTTNVKWPVNCTATLPCPPFGF